MCFNKTLAIKIIRIVYIINPLDKLRSLIRPKQPRGIALRLIKQPFLKYLI